MKIKNSALLTSALMLLAGCGSPPPQTAPVDPYSDIAQYLSPSLSSYVRDQMAPMIRLLPTEWRDDVILLDMNSQQLYSNTTETPGVIVKSPGNGLYPASLGSNLSSQAVAQPECTSGAKFRDQQGNLKSGTGVLYRIHTPPGTYDRLKNRVTLPREEAIYDFENIPSQGGDTAHVYMGGWADAGQPLEVGLKHNTQNRNWSPYIATTKGRASIRIDYPYRGNKKYNFDSGTAVFMELVLIGEGTPNQYAIFVTNGTYNNVQVRYVIGTKLTAANGLYDWQLPITSLRFYRTTSIAQSNVTSGREYMSNSSFFNGTKWDLGAYGRTLGVNSAPTQTWRDAIGCLVGQEGREVRIVRPLGNTVEEEIVTLNSSYTGPYSVPNKVSISAQ